MYIVLFSFLIVIFVSCAPATISQQSCPSPSIYPQSYPADSKTTCLNFIWPLNGEVVNSFGTRVNHTPNKGLNIKAKPQETVVASESGKVAFASYIKGWGKTLILKHTNNFYTVYANLDNLKVKEGVLVKKGDSIGQVAAAASGGEGLLHFEIRKKYVADNPLRYLRAN